jgi:hypothetical protein
MASLSDHLNSTIFVRIPAFREGGLVSCELKGIEPSGIWLAGANLTDSLKRFANIQLPDESTAVFFPFSQIAYLLRVQLPLPKTKPSAATPRGDKALDERAGGRISRAPKGSITPTNKKMNRERKKTGGHVKGHSASVRLKSRGNR